MEENPYRSPREFTVSTLEMNRARLTARLAVLKPTLAAGSGLAAFSAAIAVYERDASLAIAATIFLGFWFVIALSCARIAGLNTNP